MVGIGLLAGGCAGVPLPASDSIVTGSVAARPAAYQAGEPVPSGVQSGDWAVARLALGEALAAPSGAPSVPWENLASSTRGTVTPVGEAAPRDGASCREFLMSFVREGNEQWLQGEACRAGRSTAWRVDQTRLLQRT